jgi:hypothetical protein
MVRAGFDTHRNFVGLDWQITMDLIDASDQTHCYLLLALLFFYANLTSSQSEPILHQ